jgi:hypothetical protein
MKPLTRRLIILTALLAAHTAEAKLEFNRDIRPILSENCFQCHGFDKNTREAGLRLDVREAAMADNGGVRAIVPNDPGKSELVHRLFTKVADDVMPPPDAAKHMSEKERNLLKQWIAEGAEYQQHWAYIPPQRPAAPPSSLSTNPIDAFVLARLKKEGLAPSPRADKITLTRRLSFDLTGLPPHPGLAQKFMSSDDPKLYEVLVDHFLKSPHYGERMAVYWLDLVRWADTMGFHSDDERFSTPYRDYVINAFNSNKSFDQFTREQIAGDLIEHHSEEQLIASGYNRMNQVTGEGGAQPKEYRAKYMADKTRNTSSVWLAATLGCAECHDHKFDPYTIKDFYTFAAFFADLEEPDLVSKGRGSGIFQPAIYVSKNNEDAQKLSAAETKLAELKAAKADKNAIAAIDKTIKEIKARGTYTVISKTLPKPRMMRVLDRGNWMDTSGEVVEPAVPDFMNFAPTDTALNRLDLANWMVDRKNPLTARVFVNRLWYLFFGSGFSDVLDDLGNQGEWPSHPELLDWLAVEFMDSGWDVKHMVKLIVTSSTYQQQSQSSAELDLKDPKNRLLARQSRTRLPAEFVRDTALSVSGLLNTEIGGRSTKPYQPDGYWADSYKSVGNPHKYTQDHGEKLYRRGLYTFWKRTFIHPSLMAFDAPTREECVAKRPSSNTPLQALVLLNDPTYVEAARVLAQRMMTEGGESADDKIIWAHQQVLTRNPDATELKMIHTLRNQHLTTYSKDPEAAKALISNGEAAVPKDLDPIELAAWTSVTRTLLNLHEAITRL